MRNYAALISEELGLTELQVKNTLDLLESGATIPFVARYRKEVTDSMDEVQIAAVRDLHAKWMELDKRRAAILASIKEQGKLTPELEDLYLPYRPKRKTKASGSGD